MRATSLHRWWSARPLPTVPLSPTQLGASLSTALSLTRRCFHNPSRLRGVGPRPDQPSRRTRQSQALRRKEALTARLTGHIPLHSPVVPALPPLLSLPPRPLPYDSAPFTAATVSASLPVYSLSTGRLAGSSVTLPPLLFAAPLRRDVLHRVVEWQRAGARQGTAKTKDRGEVSGSGKKPHPQKGTGRARQGTKRAPHHRGGGVAHGKEPRDFSFHLTKKLRALGLRTALTVKHAQGGLRILEDAGQGVRGPQ